MDAVVFAGRNALDDQNLRAAVVRIPEVGIRIREAQRIMDKVRSKPLDLSSFLSSSNEAYLHNINLKSLASAVVQVGLYDRYSKLGPKADLIVGTSNNDSAARVCAGEITLEQMVEQNAEICNAKPLAIADASLQGPILSGISLTEYTAYRKLNDDDKYEPIGITDMDFIKLIRQLIEKEGVRRFVNIGPGDHSLVRMLRQNFDLYDIEVSESIDLDPMLTWFWRDLNESEMAVAYC